METPLNRRLASLVTFPAWWSRIRPSVNISEWMPYPPPGPSASLVATMFGTAPIPIWSVAPSVTKDRACSAMASSMASGSGWGSVKGAPSDSTRTSTSSRGMVLV